jgi:hypothetical protein
MLPDCLKLAEREGFEPSDGSPHRLISSQVQSTTLPPLQVFFETLGSTCSTRLVFIFQRTVEPLFLTAPPGPLPRKAKEYNRAIVKRECTAAESYGFRRQADIGDALRNGIVG